LIENFERDTFELYNLNLDTAEKHNLVQLHPHLYKILYDDLKLWQEKTGAQIPSVNPDWNPANEGKW
jgi:arylsulfatase A